MFNRIATAALTATKEIFGKFSNKKVFPELATQNLLMYNANERLLIAYSVILV